MKYEYIYDVHFRTPNNKCFSTKYPETITLCSGNTAKIPITFRPLEKVSYFAYYLDIYILFRVSLFSL